MTTNWSHLPNAAHIDAVLASVKANPEQWGAASGAAAWGAASMPAYNAAWGAARNAASGAAAWGAASMAAYNAAWDAARLAASGAAYNAAWDAARDAILALVAYDDCAHMLDSSPDDLRILSKLGSHAATLMIPASIAFKSIREKEKLLID